MWRDVTWCDVTWRDVLYSGECNRDVCYCVCYARVCSERINMLMSSWLSYIQSLRHSKPLVILGWRNLSHTFLVEKTNNLMNLINLLSMNITLTSGDNGTPKFFSCALTNSMLWYDATSTNKYYFKYEVTLKNTQRINTHTHTQSACAEQMGNGVLLGSVLLIYLVIRIVPYGNPCHHLKSSRARPRM